MKKIEKGGKDNYFNPTIIFNLKLINQRLVNWKTR